MDKKIISFDLGTGGNKASLYDAAGNCLASAFVPYATHYPQVGWHEQRPADWWQAVVESTRRLLQSSQAEREAIVALAISGHSLGAVPVDRQGNLLRQATPDLVGYPRPAGSGSVFQARGPGRVVPDHRQRIPGSLLHHLQGDVVPETRAGDVAEGRQDPGHQGLHQLPADRQADDRLLLRLGHGHLQPEGLELRAEVYRRQRHPGRGLAGDRPLHPDSRPAPAGSRQGARAGPGRAGGLRRGGQLVHGAGRQEHPRSGASILRSARRPGSPYPPSSRFWTRNSSRMSSRT